MMAQGVYLASKRVCMASVPNASLTSESNTSTLLSIRVVTKLGDCWRGFLRASRPRVPTARFHRPCRAHQLSQRESPINERNLVIGSDNA
jgi:hypothetical protein